MLELTKIQRWSVMKKTVCRFLCSLRFMSAS